MTPDPNAADATRLADMAAFPEMNPGPVIRTDESGVIVLVNAAARTLFGRDDLAGQQWLAICPEADKALWARVVAGEDRLHHESEIDGRSFTFIYRRPSSHGSIFIYGNDITERKRDERLLAVQAAQIAQMARFPEMNPGPVFRADRDARVLLANAAARDLFGGESLIGRCWKDLCPGLDDAGWDRILATTDVIPYEVRFGERTYLFNHRRTPDGDLVFIYGNEITALRAAEEALRHSEKMATLGTLAAGVAHELNNPAAAAARGASQLRDAFAKLQDALIPLTGVSLTPARAASLFELVRWDRDHSARASHIDPLTRSDLEGEIESWLDEHDVELSWEQAPALVSLGYDLDELNRLNNDWGDSTPAVVAFVARAQPVLALAREIEDATRRISEIVGALKTYSHLGAAPVRAIDVTEGIESTLVMMRNKLKAGITVVREYEPDLPRIDAFGGELNQVWTNLIDNAADAMHEKGTITVRARRDGEHVVIEIEDDGPGVPEGARSFIFDPFFTTKEPGKGTGLGLSTSRNIIVKKHAGAIDFRSRPGSTTFIVRLPIHVPPSGGVPDPSNSTGLQPDDAGRPTQTA